MPCSAVGRSENPGGGARSNVVGIIYPLVEIGLIDLPKTGGGAQCVELKLRWRCAQQYMP